ncbi:hypothetical protein BN946_scf184873.g9 [Trametes cinnabarina]|uniref:F-box domain-containing protein n=1 Tax=Pycnoporus cinnabarinus TaxID=5643 RepID=A0A060SNG2_PYCCI|nr:hypothetical protein BN946_scf184873.g9 [Trametes cinnabarina]
MTAIQQALLNMDVLEEIFSWLDFALFDGASPRGQREVGNARVRSQSQARKRERERRSTLASAARLCKAFCEFALPVLWYHMESVVPLVQLLSSCEKVWHRACLSGRGTLSGLGPSIATYVRALYPLDTPQQGVQVKCISEAGWANLIRVVGDRGPLLPNLETLDWLVECSVEIAAMSLVWSPTITKATVCLLPIDRYGQVRVEGPPYWPADWQLVRFLVDHLEPAFPSRCHDLTIFRSKSITSLRVLSGDGNLIGAFCSLDLRSLEFRSSLTVDAATFARNCAIWGRSFSNLETFKCDMTKYDGAHHGYDGPLFLYFAPLLQLSRLREVYIYGQWSSMTLDDDDLLIFAQCWPSLEVLHMSLDPREPQHEKPGLRGMAALAKSCPRLKDLLLMVLDDGLGDDSSLPLNSEGSNPCHGLRKLEVVEGVSADAYRAIRERIFPCLDMQPNACDGRYYVSVGLEW